MCIFLFNFFVTPAIDPRDRGRRLSQHTKSRKNEFYDLSLQIVNFQTWNLLSFKIYLAKSWIVNVWIWPSAANFRSFRRFHFENVANVFRPDYAGEIWKRNNHRPFCFRDGLVWTIGLTVEKSCVSNYFLRRSVEYRAVVKIWLTVECCELCNRSSSSFPIVRSDETRQSLELK